MGAEGKLMGDPIILNATPLTNFALAGRANLLLSLWGGDVYTTPEVLDEYQAGVANGKLPAGAWKKLPLIRLTSAEEGLMLTMSARLGRGECSCIAAAYQRRGLLVTDDLDARRAARGLSVAVTGSVGALAACIQAGLLTLQEANLLLAGMIAAGFRSPVSRLDDLLKDSK